MLKGLGQLGDMAKLMKQAQDMQSKMTDIQKQLEELDDNCCKWPIGHPDEKSFYFCGRSSLKDFSYCKLHLLYAYQPKGKKEDSIEKDEGHELIDKKIKSA